MRTFTYPQIAVSLSGGSTLAEQQNQSDILTDILTSAQTSEGLLGSINTYEAGRATEATLAAVLAKIIAAPATSALQTTGNSSLSSIDTKLSSQSTAANQTTANSSLSSIDTKLSSQATAANQTTANSSLSSIDTKLTSQATAANQTTANSSLSSIDTKLTSQATAANQTALATLTGAVTETAPTTDIASSGLNGRLQRIAQRLTSLIAQLPATLGIKTAANSLSIAPASDAVFVCKEAGQATATLANVTSSATTSTLQASNANRRGLTVHNDSTSILYLKFGATASTTSYTVKIQPDGYYELPQPIYTGVVDGIWSAANGAARMTEW